MIDVVSLEGNSNEWKIKNFVQPLPGDNSPKPALFGVQSIKEVENISEKIFFYH